MTPSVDHLWTRYRALHPGAPALPCAVFHFCDNAVDADLCAGLVARGVKRATACSLAELELEGQPLPQAGDLSIVTTWEGRAVAVIRTAEVVVRRFGDVDAAFAATEGEGDGSLAWWRDAHYAYFSRVLAGISTPVDDDLLIACETFDCVLLADQAPSAN